MKNVFKTVVLISALSALFLLIGHTIAGEEGLYFALFFSFIFNIVGFWFSDKIVLTMYRAKEVKEGNLYEIVSRLARKAVLPMPKVYIVPSKNPNAFATGRSPNSAAVAATEGLLETLDEYEIEAVMAHEMTHVKNRDTLISTMAAIIASAIMHLTFIARFALIFGRNGKNNANALTTIFMIILAPIAAVLIQAAISRTREYMADKGSKELMGTGIPLSNALRKISSFSTKRPFVEATQETSHMFIMNPLNAKSMFNLFSTHPPVEERIKKLGEY